MINKTVLQGRLTADIELVDRGGFNMTEFTVAWSEKIKEQEKQCFLRCKAWRNTAEFLSKYFKKGQELVVEGQLETDSWEKDGQKQSRTLLNVDKVHFCGSKGSAATDTKPSDDFMKVADSDEELPFV